MQKTPNALRKNVAIFGSTNSGKSSLFNAILAQNAAIVSDIEGTTTDPVIKAMELIPYGPIVLIDTAGLDDYSQLGLTREQRTRSILDRTDVALFVADPLHFNAATFSLLKKELEKRQIPIIFVWTKSDLFDSEYAALTKDLKDAAIRVSINDNASIELLKDKIIEKLRTNDISEFVMGDLDARVIVMVIPIDNEMPKGRLILPQVQLIRECLDSNKRCVLTTLNSFRDTMAQTKDANLVICDSQVFHEVNNMISDDIALTSFSIIMAKKKGDIDLFVNGAKAIHNLKDSSKILIAECCTHSKTHEDIGTVKLPNLLKKFTGCNLQFVHCYGNDFPQDLSSFDLIIHCGGCMISKKELLNRISFSQDVPISNYGVVLAFLNGILERSLEYIK